MNKKSVLIVIILIVMCTFLTGCWNYNETNNLRIVTGVAIDYSKDEDLYIITIEVIKVSGGEGEASMSGETFECKGTSIFDAIRNMISKTGKKLYWSAATVAIISEDVAKNGIIPVLDVILRDKEKRSELYLLISREETAGEIFDVRKLKRQKIIAYHLENTFQYGERTSSYLTMPAWRFVKNLYSSIISPTCPGVKLVTYNDTTLQQIGETAVFKKDRLVGWISQDETKYFLWITDNFDGGIYPISVKEDSSHYEMVLEIFKSKTTKKAEYINDELTVSINISTTANIGEIMGQYDFSNTDNIIALESIIEEKIKNGIENLIGKVQKEYNSDIFELGLTIKKDMPKIWKDEIESNWDVIFPKLKTKVNVDFKIRGSATTRKPIEVQD